MTDRLTDEDLNRLRDLADKATPGPWEWDGTGVNNGLEGNFSFDWCSNGSPQFNGSEQNANEENDGAFIAAARDALPRLLSEVTDLRHTLGRFEEAAADREHMTRITLPSGAVAVVASVDLTAEMDAGLIEAEARAAATENLLSEVRALVDAERRQHGPSAFSDALWETLTLEVDAAPPAEAAGAIKPETA